MNGRIEKKTERNNVIFFHFSRGKRKSSLARMFNISRERIDEIILQYLENEIKGNEKIKKQLERFDKNI